MTESLVNTQLGTGLGPYLIAMACAALGVGIMGLMRLLSVKKTTEKQTVAADVTEFITQQINIYLSKQNKIAGLTGILITIGLCLFHHPVSGLLFVAGVASAMIVAQVTRKVLAVSIPRMYSLRHASDSGEKPQNNADENFNEMGPFKTQKRLYMVLIAITLLACIGAIMGVDLILTKNGLSVHHWLSQYRDSATQTNMTELIFKARMTGWLLFSYCLGFGLYSGFTQIGGGLFACASRKAVLEREDIDLELNAYDVRNPATCADLIGDQIQIIKKTGYMAFWIIFAVVIGAFSKTLLANDAISIVSGYTEYHTHGVLAIMTIALVASWSVSIVSLHRRDDTRFYIGWVGFELVMAIGLYTFYKVGWLGLMDGIALGVSFVIAAVLFIITSLTNLTKKSPVSMMGKSVVIMIVVSTIGIMADGVLAKLEVEWLYLDLVQYLYVAIMVGVGLLARALFFWMNQDPVELIAHTQKLANAFYIQTSDRKPKHASQAESDAIQESAAHSHQATESINDERQEDEYIKPSILAGITIAAMLAIWAYPLTSVLGLATLNQPHLQYESNASFSNSIAGYWLGIVTVLIVIIWTVSTIQKITARIKAEAKYQLTSTPDVLEGAILPDYNNVIKVGQHTAYINMVIGLLGIGGGITLLIKWLGFYGVMNMFNLILLVVIVIRFGLEIMAVATQNRRKTEMAWMPVVCEAVSCMLISYVWMVFLLTILIGHAHFLGA